MNRSIQALAALILIAGTMNAQAAARYWDSSADAGLQHGDGTWNTTDANWNANANGSGALTTFASGSDHPAFNGVGGTSVILVPNTISTSGNNPPWLGAGYTVIVTNGATLTLHQVTGIGEHALGSGNTLKVVGGVGLTSVFNAQYDVYVGRYGTNANNRLIADGAGDVGSAVVTNVRDLVVGGNNGDYFGSTSNSVQIVNGGSLHMNVAGSDLRVGDALGSMGNYIEVSNGSLLRQTVTANIQVGRASATNNSVLIQGGALGTSLWTLPSTGNDLLIGNGNYSVGNRVTIDGAGGTGGAIVTNVGQNAATALAIGNGTGADSNSLRIVNGGLVYMRVNPNPNMYVTVANGAQRSDNSLIITNGGQLRAVYSLYVGGAGATNNYALVQGGALGTSLIDASGNNGVFVGIGASSFNNRLTVDGQGIANSAMVTNAGPLNIGSGGAGASSNSVQIVNGGVFKNNAGTLIGVVAGAFENFMTITNGGEFWFGNTVDVGSRGNAGGGSSNNWLLVQGGSGVATAKSTTGGNFGWNIGLQINCNGNRVTIDGLGIPGSAIVTNVSQMRLGVVAGANDNRLEVRNKGDLWLANNTFQVGVLAGATGSVVSVDGGDIHVTTLQMLGTRGLLEILNGGRYLMNANNHTLIGSGAGASNTLSVASGGLLHGTFYDSTIRNIEIGASGSTGNLLRVDGGTVTNFATIFVGSTGAGSGFNEMVITNGGKVYSGLGSIGASTAGQVSNRVTVTGSGSLWDLKGNNITLGLHTTTGNVLTVEAGGLVTNVNVLNVSSNNVLALLGGTIAVTNINVSNQTVTVIGDGVSVATLDLAGGTGMFTNGLLVASNAMLRGTGVIRTGGATSATLTNGAAISAGSGDASGTLTVSNLTWQGGGGYRCDIANVTGTAGSGWDLLSVRDLTAAPDGKKLVVRLAGAAANFSPGLDYSLKILVYTNTPGLVTDDFEVDHTGFVGAGSGNWSIGVDTDQKALMLNYSGLTLPAAPDGLVATAVSYSRIDLAWSDNSNNETGFKIERKTGAAGEWSEIATVGADVAAYTNDTGLAPETIYYYRVRAYNPAGDTAYSNEDDATTPQGPPLAPSGLTATTISASRIDLAWTDNANNETGFQIQRKTGAAGEWGDIASVGANDTAYTNSTGLAPATEYYYQVRATNASGVSAYTDAANATTLPLPPTAPSGLTATAMSKSRIDLSWTDTADNETGFKIERKTGAGAFSEIATVGANVNAYTNTGLTGATEYTYRVRATNTGGDSGYSNEAGDTTLDDRRFVAKHGSNANAGTQEHPWETIQYAVTNVDSGDRIFIGEGIYTENVLFTNTIHSLTLKGGHNTNDWSWSPSNHVTVISGTTGARIQLGGDSSYNGLPSASNTIMGLTLAGGQYGIRSPWHGSVMGSVTISHCIITNQGANGWSISANGGCDFTLINTLVGHSDIGLYSPSGAGPVGTNYVFNCTFVTNKRANVWVSSKTVIRNTIAYGAYGAGGANYEGYGIAAGATEASSADVSHSLVYGNTVNTNGLVSYGDNMITNAAPVFVNYAGGNFRLVKGSPGMDQGITIPAITDDLDLNPRPWGQPSYDMGAYEIYSPPLGSVFRFR